MTELEVGRQEQFGDRKSVGAFGKVCRGHFVMELLGMASKKIATGNLCRELGVAFNCEG